MSGDEFGGPAPAGNKKTEDGIELDRWNRYLLPDPQSGEIRPWIRASTVAKTLDDGYNLTRWRERMVARGMALRPDLIALAASIEDIECDAGKAELNSVAVRAAEAAGATSRRDTGTALHRFAQQHEAGTLRPEQVPPHLRDDAAKYQTLMMRHGLHSMLAERVVCVPEWGVAGRLDRLVLCPDGLYRVLDIKSGKTMKYGHLALAVQLAIYVHGITYGYYDAAEQRWIDCPPNITVATDFAFIAHTPSGSDDPGEMLIADVYNGTRYVELALAVREARRAKNLVVEYPWGFAAVTSVSEAPALGPGTDPPQLRIAGRISDAQTIEDISKIWQEAQQEGLWTDALERQAHDRAAAITAGIITAAIEGPPPTLSLPPSGGYLLSPEQPAPSTAPPAGTPVNVDDYTLVRTAADKATLASLWEVMHPAGRWTTEIELAARARVKEMDLAPF